jgi:hypothetical protein
MFSAKQYHIMKWLFINEINEDELYYNDINWFWWNTIFTRGSSIRKDING